MRPEQLSLQGRVERHISALVVLARRWPQYESDAEQSTRALNQAAAVALGVERASLWFLDLEGTALLCEDLYEVSRHRHSRGYKFTQAECPAYFTALLTEGWIVAADAHQDPRTACFSSSYLTPHGIGALLDMPVRLAGEVVGVLRIEHVGGPRAFQTDEQLTANYLASLASLAVEGQRRAELETRDLHARSVLDAALNAADSASLILDQRGGVVHYNQRLLDLWRMHPTMMGPAGDNGRRIQHMASQSTDPARFIARYRRISADLTQSSEDEIVLTDGRVIQRSSAPQWVGGEAIGRAWNFREIGRGA